LRARRPFGPGSEQAPSLRHHPLAARPSPIGLRPNMAKAFPENDRIVVGDPYERAGAELYRLGRNPSRLPSTVRSSAGMALGPARRFIERLPLPAIAPRRGSGPGAPVGGPKHCCWWCLLFVRMLGPSRFARRPIGTMIAERFASCQGRRLPGI